MMTATNLHPQSLRTATPFMDLFPVKLSTLGAITESMEEIGFDPAEPIVIWDGMVIDGHTRLGAALAAGLREVPVVEKDFADEDEALQYAIKRQRDRRNLTDTDLLRCLDVLDRRKNQTAGLMRGPVASPEVTEIQGTYDEPKGRSAGITAEILGTSKTKVERARAVLDHAPEELKAQVLAGEKTINAAYNETRPTPAPRPLPNRTDPDATARLEAARARNEIAAQLEECQEQLRETAKLLRDTEEENKAFARVLEADDQVAAAMAEVKRFKELARVTQERNNGLMGQNHALAKDCRRWMNKFLRLEKLHKGELTASEPEPNDEDLGDLFPDLDPAS